MHRWRTIIALVAALATAPAAAQLVPGIPGVNLPGMGLPTEPLLRTLEETTEPLVRTATRLLEERTDRLTRLIRSNRDIIEVDIQGEPARRGELLVLDPSPADLALIRTTGLGVAESEQLGALGITVVRLTLPKGMSLAEGQRLLAERVPGAQVSADNLHFQSGSAVGSVAAQAASGGATIATPVGMIDGAPSTAVAVTATRGFAKGAPRASNHGSAVASLLRQSGVRDIRVADVYGTDKAGGNALAIARALSWLIGDGAKVVSISLVGPRNSVLEKAIAAARQRGVMVVAAVGNDGPAAPPAYPASYAGVVAVTGVDGRKRALIEAGRALHLDYAAPAADMRAANAKGQWIKVRGTSFATPFVAARVAAALQTGSAPLAKLNREAEDLGPRGPDDTYGRGLVCGGCARR
ncbi:S8 family serine peptidase [Altererythrobacter soli]|uniref:S8 family serine peptidase n=1 Tax=Croceibacterium soli TaxID=1739690 RepID=A0A6I4UR95_9SPHN|nr:S8 family serine peptidase [Croceibacterium soli]MXP41510.1 S8 family serine peptidase [Croceibacterium soli]